MGKKYIDKILDFSIFIIFMSVFLFYYSPKLLVLDFDILWHIKIGDWILENKKIFFREDIFSYTIKEYEWEYISWGYDVLFSFLYKLFGFGGIIYFFSLLYTFMFFLIYKFSKKLKFGVLKFLLLFIFLFVSMKSHWSFRNYIFSHFFSVLWFIFIEQYLKDNDKKKIYFIFLIQIFWVNIHSTFIYGFIIGAMFCLGEMMEYIFTKEKKHIENLKKIISLGFLLFLCSFINPKGINIYKYFLKNEKIEFFNSRTIEFLSFDFNKNIFYILPVMVLIFTIITKKKRLNFSHIFILLFWFSSGLMYYRHYSIFALFLLLISILYIGGYKMEEKKEIELQKKKEIKFVFGYLFLSSIFFIASLFLYPQSKTFEDYVSSKKDKKFLNIVKAVKHLKENPIDGNMFNGYDLGSYLIWRFYPEKKVFIDQRATVYDLKFLKMVDYAEQTGDVKKIEYEYEITHYIVEKYFNLYKFLIKNEKYELYYENESIAIIIKKEK